MLLSGVRIVVGRIFFVRGDRMLLGGFDFVQGDRMLLGGFTMLRGTECYWVDLLCSGGQNAVEWLYTFFLTARFYWVHEMSQKLPVPVT
jgi:hypothetical protein